MKTITGIQADSLPDNVVATVGTMDGVHVGHATIVSRTVSIARHSGNVSLVVTFDPHPRQIVQNVDVPLLTTIAERRRLLEHLDVDYMCVLKFDRETASLSAQEFIESILVEKYGVSHVVVGYDHGFGHDRKGNAEVLRRLGKKHGYKVTEVGEEKVEGESVSSSNIRKLIEHDGAVSQAGILLGRPYSLTGLVVEGDKRGRKIGFPTANLSVDDTKLIPANGAYRVLASVDGVPLVAMLNIGHRPTFGTLQRTIEVHIIDFESDLYGKELKIDFLQRLRPEQKFDSVDELIQQLSRDRDRCRGAHSTVGD